MFGLKIRQPGRQAGQPPVTGAAASQLHSLKEPKRFKR